MTRTGRPTAPATARPTGSRTAAQAEPDREDTERQRILALLDRASYAGIRDVLAGGHDANLSSCTAAGRLLGLLPDMPYRAQDALAFAEHAVTVLVRDLGVRQIIHTDHGFPHYAPRRNVHEIAQTIDPACRTVYADADPVVHARARCVLTGSDRVAVADIGLASGVHRVLEHPAVAAHLDLARPVAVLCTAVEAVPDTVTSALTADLARLLPAGGYLAVCQLSVEDTHLARQVDEVMATALDGRWDRLRTPAQTAGLLRDLPLVEPLGVVEAPHYIRSSYRPAGPPRAAVLGAIARITPSGPSPTASPPRRAGTPPSSSTEAWSASPGRTPALTPDLGGPDPALPPRAADSRPHSNRDHIRLEHP
ncbi:SAM-dependent methyltransferase [Kitasatospora sp. NPDC088556]|uniref:SAM-dependent methyltransferase n=1 Tax=Kitasatospora sp. NPDC088556 TaxID=3364076 RepID=UPI0037F8AEE1